LDILCRLVVHAPISPCRLIGCSNEKLKKHRSEVAGKLRGQKLKIC
jgi:hypothetical protein